jgi:hypothetical protein
MALELARYRGSVAQRRWLHGFGLAGVSVGMVSGVTMGICKHRK